MVMVSFSLPARVGGERMAAIAALQSRNQAISPVWGIASAVTLRLMRVVLY
jgi:hypothetical protein